MAKEITDPKSKIDDKPSITEIERDLVRKGVLSKEVIGEPLYRAYIDQKSGEWWDFHNSISKWEIDTCLTKY